MQPETPKKPQSDPTIWTRIWNALHRRPFTKLAALLIAIGFWAIVIASDPTLPIEKTILNAPVTVSGQETLRSRGLTVMDDLTSGTITVKMRVEVKQADYDRADADTFTPRLELAQQITHEGRQQVFFSVPANNYGTVLSFEPEYVELDVEPFISRSRVPVVITHTGESETPLWVSGETADPSQISVSGPKSLVDKVRRAVVTLPLNGLSEARPHDAITAQIELQDENKSPVTSPLLRITNESITVDSARIEMDVYPMRDVPVDVASAITGIPAHGYMLQGVRITPSSVAVAADAEMLAEIEALYVSAPLDVSGLQASATATVSLRSVASAAHVASPEVVIEADIVPAPHVHVYNNLPVTIMGMAPELTSKLSHTEMDVIIRGDYDKVQALSRDDITLYVDASELKDGVHLIDVQCIVNGTDNFTFEPELARVTLTLTKEAAGN